MMRYNTMLKRSDLLIRGLFLAAAVIGSIVDRRQLNPAPEAPSAAAPVAAAGIGLALPPSPACSGADAGMPAPSTRLDRATSADSSRRHVLSGSVRSRAGCTPIGGARIEFWPSGDDVAKHAILFADANGKYRLQCDLPAADQAYIYLRVSADGYATLTTQYQPTASRPEGEFDILLQPGK